MNMNKFLRSYIFSALILSGIMFLVGCQDNSVESTTPQASTDKQAVVDVINADSLIASFEPNFNEEGEVTYLAKTNTEIKPFKVWQKMQLTNKVVDVTFDADTAYAHITKTFDGTLYISGSLDVNASTPDTLIKKSFTSVINRKAILVKITKEDTSKTRWVIKAVSLPEGGTPESSIKITKVTVFLPNEDTLSISSPNDYYLVRKWGWFWWKWHNVPVLEHDRDLKIQVELTSSYADTDFVSLTFGANRFGVHRCKKRFELISSTDNGGVYDKVYEQTFTSNYYPGFFHAIINAIPKQVIYDDSAAVESNTWGIPYFIKF